MSPCLGRAVAFPTAMMLASIAPQQPTNGPAAQDRWLFLDEMFSDQQVASMGDLLLYLVLGGLIAMFLRWLYQRSSPNASGDSIARVFPLLTLVTIAVIAVVKSSLALSLGLVGALSIVRFRAAIKDPEELVYLFLCIGVGLALGAQQPLLCLALVVVATVFALVFDRWRPGARKSDGFLTVVGEAARHFAGGEGDALRIVREQFPRLTVQRCDVDGDQGQLRMQLHRLGPDEGPELVATLRALLPECQISYVNASAVP